MVYIDTEGYLINDKLFEISQHCQRNTLDFLIQTLKLSHRITYNPLFARLNSKNDVAENLGWSDDDIIKATILTANVGSITMRSRLT